MGFILNALNSPPLNSGVKNKVMNFFSTIQGLKAAIKNIKQNIGENIVFYETSIKIYD